MTRHHILKKIWGMPKYTRNGLEKTVQQDQKDKRSNTPPPPYCESPSHAHSQGPPPDSNASYPLLTKFAQERVSLRYDELRLAIVEILAVTFVTDRQRLRKAFAKTSPGWDDTEDTGDPSYTGSTWFLAEICALVRKLESEVARNRWLLLHPQDRDLAQKLLLEPVKYGRMNLDFVLEVLGRFRPSKDCRRPESTLLDFWMLSSRSTDLGDTIASHALLLRSLRLKKEICLVVEDHIAAFQKQKGWEELGTSKEFQEESLSPKDACCWPLSDGYMDLARTVRLSGSKRSDVAYDPFEPSRTRLREWRKLQEPQE